MDGCVMVGTDVCECMRAEYEAGSGGGGEEGSFLSGVMADGMVR